MKVEFLWFDDCPNHEAARELLHSVLAELGIQAMVEDVNVSDPSQADRLRFPGSPTIRVNGHDIEPDFHDPGDYTPRCRIYFTGSGMSGVPERAWIEEALIVVRDE